MDYEELQMTVLFHFCHCMALYFSRSLFLKGTIL